jgi:spore germination protein KC
MNHKKIPLLLFLHLSIILLSGCWDRQEVNDLALVTAAGIDKKSDETIELTVLVYIPKDGGSQQSMEGSGGDGGNQKLVRSAEGTTIADAMSKLQEKLPRLIFWGHSEVFIFDEDLAKNGISCHIDFIIRHPQLRERSQIFISKQKAKEILSLLPPLERDVSEVLRELATHKIGLEITAKELAQMLISDSSASTVPWIKILPSEEGEVKRKPLPISAEPPYLGMIKWLVKLMIQ